MEQHETQSARNARISRESARRSREYRARQKDAKLPEARDVYAAAFEAVQFLLRANFSQVDRTEVPTSVMTLQQIVNVTSIILRRDGYDYRGSRSRLVKMLAPMWTHEGYGSVPSLYRHAGAFELHPPRGAAEWTAGELSVIRSFMSVGDKPGSRYSQPRPAVNEDVRRDAEN